MELTGYTKYDGTRAYVGTRANLGMYDDAPDVPVIAPFEPFEVPNLEVFDDADADIWARDDTTAAPEVVSAFDLPNFDRVVREVLAANNNETQTMTIDTIPPFKAEEFLGDENWNSPYQPYKAYPYTEPHNEIYVDKDIADGCRFNYTPQPISVPLDDVCVKIKMMMGDVQSGKATDKDSIMLCMKLSEFDIKEVENAVMKVFPDIDSISSILSIQELYKLAYASILDNIKFMAKGKYNYLGPFRVLAGESLDSLNLSLKYFVEIVRSEEFTRTHVGAFDFALPFEEIQKIAEERIEEFNKNFR